MARQRKLSARLRILTPERAISRHRRTFRHGFRFPRGHKIGYPIKNALQTLKKFVLFAHDKNQFHTDSYAILYDALFITGHG